MKPEQQTLDRLRVCLASPLPSLNAKAPGTQGLPGALGAGAFNPFLPSRHSRSSDLSVKEGVKVFDAVSFCMWQHGAVMNTHIVILWEGFRVYDHARATTLLSEYLNQSKKWAAVGLPDGSRQRYRERTGNGFKFRNVYVHENGKQRGFHTHILCTVPHSAVQEFSAWSRKTLARLTRHPGDGRSLRVVASRAKTEVAAVQDCWRWVRYILKQLDPGNSGGWGNVNETPRLLREILRTWQYRESLPVTSAQLVGGSHDIWTKAQAEAGFRSALRYGDVARIYGGQELDDWRARCAANKIAQMLPEI